MTFKEIKDLIKLVSDSDLKEVKVKNKEFEIKIRTDKDNSDAQIITTAAPLQGPTVAAAPVAPVADASPSTAPSSVDSEQSNENANLIEIKSPMVGTFYRSPSPDKPVYTKVGENITSGSVVCIIEAMKLFNEIESEVTGKIVKVLAEDASPVEYEQVLFLVDPNG